MSKELLMALVSPVLYLLAVLGTAVALGAVQYVLAEQRGRARWQRLVAGTRVAGAEASPYRADVTAVPVPFDRAPRTARGVACASFYLGQMFVPGLLLGLYGLLAMGIGLVSIPGLVVAARVYASALRLLSPDERTAPYVERTARWSTVLNVIILGLCAVAGVWGAFASEPAAFGLSLPTAAYAVISLVHAHALRRAAALVREALAATAAASATAVRVEDRAALGAAAYGDDGMGAPNLAASASQTTFGA